MRELLIDSLGIVGAIDLLGPDTSGATAYSERKCVLQSALVVRVCEGLVACVPLSPCAEFKDKQIIYSREGSMLELKVFAQQGEDRGDHQL